MSVIKLGYATNTFEGAKAILESTNVAIDLITSLLGPIIANGAYRAVYQHTLDESKVIKIEYGHNDRKEHDCIMNNSFCNVQEFLLWREIEGLKGNLAWVKNNFAPVHWISPSGYILCMEKTEPLPTRKRPDKIPAFLWDVKQENFGWIGKNLVCHDYAHVSSVISYNRRMKDVSKIWN